MYCQILSERGMQLAALQDQSSAPVLLMYGESIANDEDLHVVSRSLI